MPLCGDDHKKLIDRISRIDGQVKGIRKMVQDDRDCLEVLKQIAATVGAMRSLGMVLLEDHLKGCVSKAIRNDTDHERLIREVTDIFFKFTR